MLARRKLPYKSSRGSCTLPHDLHLSAALFLILAALFSTCQFPFSCSSLFFVIISFSSVPVFQEPFSFFLFSLCLPCPFPFSCSPSVFHLSVSFFSVLPRFSICPFPFYCSLLSLLFSTSFLFSCPPFCHFPVALCFPSLRVLFFLFPSLCPLSAGLPLLALPCISSFLNSYCTSATPCPSPHHASFRPQTHVFLCSQPLDTFFFSSHITHR